MFDRELWSAVGVLALIYTLFFMLGTMLAIVGFWLAYGVSALILSTPEILRALHLRFRKIRSKVVGRVKYWRMMLQVTKPFTRARVRARERAEQVFARLNKNTSETTAEEV